MSKARILRLLPARAAQFALRWHVLMSPHPDAGNAAAVELYRAERRGRGILAYPHYLYGLLSAARTAMAVGADAFTAIEFGVARGNGLRALERHAEYVEEHYPVKIELFGFDSGHGLLPPSDPMDCAFALPSGAFAMDEAELRESLQRAVLVLGRIEETIGPFMREAAAQQLPPIGFISVDLDVYTGTLAALQGVADPERLLPRVALYFDDLLGYPYSTADSEWAAIDAFNESSSLKIGRVFLKHQVGGTSRVLGWPDQFFTLHAFEHPAYDASEADGLRAGYSA
jgi:hypothetical protein